MASPKDFLAGARRALWKDDYVVVRGNLGCFEGAPEGWMGGRGRPEGVQEGWLYQEGGGAKCLYAPTKIGTQRASGVCLE